MELLCDVGEHGALCFPGRVHEPVLLHIEHIPAHAATVGKTLPEAVETHQHQETELLRQFFL